MNPAQKPTPFSGEVLRERGVTRGLLVSWFVNYYLSKYQQHSASKAEGSERLESPP